MAVFVSSLGIIVTLFIALALWRVQVLGKRRMEVAEEALVAFLGAADALQRIRSPLVLVYESRAADTYFDLAPEESGMPTATSYHVVLHRMVLDKEASVPLRTIAIRCRYLFGADVEKAFDQLRLQHNEVGVTAQIAAQMGARSYPPDLAEAERKRVDRIVFDTRSGDDPIQNRINEALAVIEDGCGRHLMDQATVWPFASVRPKLPPIPRWLRALAKRLQSLLAERKSEVSLDVRP